MIENINSVTIEGDFNASLTRISTFGYIILTFCTINSLNSVDKDALLNNNNNNNNGRNGSCLTWLAASLEEKRIWLIINASPRGQCYK